MRFSLHLIGWSLILVALGAVGPTQAQEPPHASCAMPGCLQVLHQDCLLSVAVLPGPTAHLGKSKAPVSPRLPRLPEPVRLKGSLCQPVLLTGASPPLFLRTRVLLL